MDKSHPQEEIAMNRRLLSLAAVAALAALPIHAFAQAKWPDKPIRIVVPFPPGGGTDTLSRLVGEKISAATKWTIVIDNKPGGGGTIGLDAIAKAAPDGYTLGMGQTANLAVNPTLYKKMPYDALKDFTPIALVAIQPQVLVVKADAPYKTLADLVNAAKAKPGDVSMGSAGSGTIGHLTGELLAREAKVKFLHVPYKGAGPALTDLLGGNVQFAFLTLPSVASMLKANRLRALAVTSEKRIAALPNVPTVAESGYKGFVTESWYGLVGPAKLPASIVAAVNAEVEKVLKQPDVIAKLDAEGNEPLGGTPEKFAERIKIDHGKWGTVVRESGITPD
jgi:tripartite-type tricarboxylate transporter receptor subunit TctC